MDKDRLYRLQLACIAEVMPQAVRSLRREFGSADRICDLGADEIDALVYLKDEEKAELKSALRRGLPVEMAGYMEKHGIWMVCADEEGYPDKVRCLEDAPYALFVRGELPDANRKCVSVIGARKCSDYGRRTAEYFGRELAKAGVSVISGMARGIDGMAQEACIDAGEKSYALLGSGVDVIYPPSNKGLYHKLIEKGGVISEYPPGRESLPFHFPMRNRLISAFCDILLVVEAREKSGTFITVNYALEQGKDVYAVPGRIEDELSRGCNRLITQGAGVAYCVEEVLLALTDTDNRHKGVSEPPKDEAGEAAGTYCEADRDDSSRRMGRICISREKPGADGKRSGREDSAAAAGRKYAGREDHAVAADPRWSGELRSAVYKYLLDAPMTAQDIYGRLGRPELKIQELLSELMQLEIEGLLLCRGGRYELA